MTRNGRVLVPATVPFWLKPASTFGLLSLTMFIERSPGFAIPSILAPLRLDADRDIVPSRFRRQSADCGSIVRRRCTRRYLPAHLRRIPLMGQRVVSWHNAKHNNDSDDFMSQPPVRPVRETFASYGSRERDITGNVHFASSTEHSPWTALRVRSVPLYCFPTLSLRPFALYVAFLRSDYYGLFDCLEGLGDFGAGLPCLLPLSFPSLAGSPVFTMEDSNKML